MTEILAHVINARFGNMVNEDTKQPFDWAKLTIIEDSPAVLDGFAGVKTGEIKVSTENNNSLIKKLHSQVAQGEIHFPCNLKLNCDMSIKGKDVSLTVIGFETVK
ncbi:hypothetical protein EGX63_24265 [Vibrio parahaemolyticus]|nr:hypothetical protein [Vibrio parahaemolyticus]